MAKRTYRSECRLVIRVDTANRLVTRTKGEVFARLYNSADKYHNKELKGYHKPEEVIDRALRYNFPFDPDVLGLVITQYRGEQLKIVDDRYVSSGRKIYTTEWSRFVDLRNVNRDWPITGFLELDIYDIIDPDSTKRHIGTLMGTCTFS